MEKLTIKELVPYLPYGLKAQTIDGVFKIVSIHNDDNVVGSSNAIDVQFYNIEYIKPLLNPISVITKAMMDELSDNAKYQIIISKEIPKYQFNFKWNDLQILLSGFFDIFGLIDRNLALPIDGKEVEGE